MNGELFVAFCAASAALALIPSLAQGPISSTEPASVRTG